MRRSAMESVLGAVVLLVAAAFALFALRTLDLSEPAGVTYTARFLRLGGLNPGADVRVNGVRVGSVTDRYLDTETFEAVVTLNVRPDIALARDTEAVITSEGLLGGKYLRLVPGRAGETLENGGELTNTRDFRSLEDTVSEIIFLTTGGS